MSVGAGYILVRYPPQKKKTLFLPQALLQRMGDYIFDSRMQTEERYKELLGMIFC